MRDVWGVVGLGLVIVGCGGSSGGAPAGAGSTGSAGATGTAGSTGTAGASGSTSTLTGSWKAVPEFVGGFDVTGIGGTADKDLFVADSYGEIFYFDGTMWQLFEKDLMGSWEDVFTLPTGDVWFAGDNGKLAVLQGQNLITVPAPDNTKIHSVWGTSVTAMWIANGSTIIPSMGFFDGTMFRNETKYTFGVDNRPDATTKSVWGSSANDVWTVGGKSIGHWNGSAWSVDTTASTAALYAVNGSAANDVWAVGNQVILHYDGKTWSELQIPYMEQNTWGDVWARTRVDAWIVGYDGFIMHWDGAKLSRVPSGTTKALFTIYGLGQNDIWAGGEGGELIHYTAGGTTVDPPRTCKQQGEACGIGECCGALRCIAIGAGLAACG
jgi:hypothetical protein